MQKFRDRSDAGRRLAAELGEYAAQDPIILALPRGGVPIGYEIARELSAPLDVWIVRKVGVPWHPELGVGAISEGGHLHISGDVLRHVRMSQQDLERAVESQRAEVEQRVRLFRTDRPRPQLRDRTVILVDDGIATGGTVRAAIRSIRAEEPRQVVLAVPVAADTTVEDLESEVDHVVCLTAPANLYAVGAWYDDFRQVADEEVLLLLERARQQPSGGNHVVA